MKQSRQMLFAFFLFYASLGALAQESIPYSTYYIQNFASGESFSSPGNEKSGQSITISAAQYAQVSESGTAQKAGGVLQMDEDSWAEYRVYLPKEGGYTIALTYVAGAGTGGALQRSVLINGAVPFKEAGTLRFPRLWNDVSRDYKQVKGNQPFPSQKELFQRQTVVCCDPLGYTLEPFMFYFQKGENTIRLNALREGMLLEELRIEAAEKLPLYAAYYDEAVKAGFQPADIEPIKIQAEDTAAKSSQGIYPINDRTSPLSEPYDPSYIILNTVGGESWSEVGDFISWKLQVPKTGLYRVGFRFKQSFLRGLYATRRLRVNGHIPFTEADDLRFYYDTSFQFAYLGSGGAEPHEYWLLLQEGDNTLTLEVSLGKLGSILQRLERETAVLNELYRKIISITGSSPDVYRDYQLYTRVSDLRETVQTSTGNLQSILADFIAEMGQENERTAGIVRMLSVLKNFDENESQVVQFLVSFKESITAMGKAVMDLTKQPLVLDYIIVSGKNAPPIQAEGNFFQFLVHKVRAFFGSFTNDYTVASGNTGIKGKSIDVWLSTGRDQLEIIRRLINESFEPVYGVKVNLKLINPDMLLPSTFTGNGPDVAIQISNTAPVNFAFRDAAYDLTNFPDFAETIQDFLPAALDSFYFNGGCYALPDQMSFPVMYYRKDIFNSLNLSVPETWEDLLALIPDLQRNYMEVYLDTASPLSLGAAVSMGTGAAINSIFLSRLYQTGGDIYTPDSTACSFDTKTAYEAFKWWTQFYTWHNFPVEADFVTRFRLGEVPIGMVDLSTYTRLSVSAPEIRGDWSIAPVPGTRQKDGSIRRDTPCVTGAGMILKRTVLAKDTVQEAWQFLRWWTNGDTQQKFARSMESILGPAGRYPVASLKAFHAIPWPIEVTKALNAMLKDLRGIPQVPGGYITGRYVRNAFLTVVTNYENPADVLFENIQLINEEIQIKREEFGLDSPQKGTEHE
ncbi:extracellular solute-binding protein [Treponema phagedenis]|uniref:extracellular solute-binding protein n=1 Tax=Treponema phagedenis TaxID=162 RepID=UPI0019816185|nr:extracellular solute-binding protein [Treponema phagedenis]